MFFDLYIYIIIYIYNLYIYSYNIYIYLSISIYIYLYLSISIYIYLYLSISILDDDLFRVLIHATSSHTSGPEFSQQEWISAVSQVFKAHAWVPECRRGFGRWSTILDRFLPWERSLFVKWTKTEICTRWIYQCEIWDVMLCNVM